MIVYAGIKHPSFGQGSEALAELAGLTIQEKQVERISERIGKERVIERDRKVQAYLNLPLMKKVDSPVDRQVDLAVIEMDGGRLQIFDRRAAATLASEDELEGQETDIDDEETDEEEPRHGHWREDKIGVLMTMTSEVSATDPCPEIPEHFVDPTRILKLAREIKSSISVPEGDFPEAADGTAELEPDTETTWTPRPQVRTTVATRAPAKKFKVILAQAAWALGFATAKRKAFVADGAAVNWTTHKGWFSDFVAILDFIHVLSYIFAAAMAGRSFRDGWEAYVNWIQKVWSGKVEEVLVGLESRQQELGQPTKDDPETSPRQIIATTIGYLRTHKDRMRYDVYRCAGLPLTSCHVESMVKLFNRRVKGTEKFWSETGAEAILQLRGDYLSENEPLQEFWERRQAEATGLRNFRRAG
jgi:hypothetical protein